MPNTRSIQFSFSGGEISPDMYGRIDQKSFQTGLKKCKNAIVRPQGPVKRRPGLGFCAENGNSSSPSRLIALQTDPPTVMEVCTNHVRFIRNGSVLQASDANSNVAYGTVREYVVPMQVLYATWSGVVSFRTINFAGTGFANHQFVDGDPIVFSWGTDPAQMIPTSPRMGAGYYYSSAGYAVSAFDKLRNLLPLQSAQLPYISTGTLALLSQTNGTPFGGPNFFPWYANVVNGQVSFTPTYVSSLPIRRLDQAHTPQPVATNNNNTVFLAAAMSHVGRPNTVTAYNTDTQIYYVKVVGPDTFQVSLTPGGPALSLSAFNDAGVAVTLPHYVMRVYLQGDCIKHSGVNYYISQSFYGQQDTFNPTGGPHATKLISMGTGGDLRVWIPVAYTNTQLARLNYAVSNDVVTLAYAGKATVDVIRYSDRRWVATSSINNATAINDCVSSYNTPSTYIVRGGRWKPTVASTYLEGPRNIPFVWGDYVVKVDPASATPYVNAPIYVVKEVTYPSGSTVTQRITLTGIDGSAYSIAGTDVNFEYEVIPSADWDALGSVYKVAAIDVNGIECLSNLSVLQYHNLTSRGASTYLRWSPLPNAVQYRIYKAANGIFGWVGETSNPYWVDENYDADLAQRPVLYDYSYAFNGEYAQAVSYFEQRRVYGGSTLYPSRIWMTRSNTLYDFGYSIPVKDTDRIVVEMAARQTERIRHLVPIGDLMVLTDQGEWQLSPVNSDVITPTTISVRKQSNFGANYTVPVTIGQTAVYVTARGGHARELGYSNDQRGYVTGDLSLRAAHLFDGKDLVDLDCIKSPFPVLWFVSTDGKLKALTYIPDEKVYAWHEHDTDGTFESTAAITEGNVDVLYAVVKRTINGQTKRYIERLAPLQEFGDTDVYLDSSLSGDGTNTTATTMRLSQVGQQGWTVGSTVTVTRSTGAFVSTDVGDYLVVYDATGSEYRVEILSVGTPTTTALARIVDDIPLAVQDVATASWAFARNQWSGLSHLEGKTVSIWADGVMQASKVVSGGSVTIDTPAIKVRIGLPYTTTVETLPIALQADAFGQGRTKNVNKVWVRMQGTQEFQIGPTTSDLVSSGTLPSGQTDGELQVTLLPAWSQDGSIVMQQSDAFPMNINGLTLEAAIGS